MYNNQPFLIQHDIDASCEPYLNDLAFTQSSGLAKVVRVSCVGCDDEEQASRGTLAATIHLSYLEHNKLLPATSIIRASLRQRPSFETNTIHHDTRHPARVNTSSSLVDVPTFPCFASRDTYAHRPCSIALILSAMSEQLNHCIRKRASPQRASNSSGSIYNIQVDNIYISKSCYSTYGRLISTDYLLYTKSSSVTQSELPTIPRKSLSLNQKTA